MDSTGPIPIRRSLYSSLLILLPFMVVTGIASAQSTPDPAWPSRSELQSRLDSLYELTGSHHDADALREIRARISSIERRLDEGDFRVGDVVQIRVAGDTTMTGTYTVDSANRLSLPGIEELSLDSVLYSEVDDVVAKTLEQYYRNPDIEVDVLKRVGVLGAVGSPGFYTVPPSSSVADVLMTAGGPTQQAELSKVELNRGKDNLLKDREEEIETLTLQQLGVQRGDRIVVPASSGDGGFGFREILGVTSGIAGLAFVLTRMF